MAKRSLPASSNDPAPRPKKLDPIIEGLFARLPPTGAEWPVVERKTWLGLMESAFNVIYEEEKDKSQIVRPGQPKPPGT